MLQYYILPACSCTAPGTIYVWSIFIVLCSLGWGSSFFCPSAAAETRLHTTRLHSHIASHLHQECTFVSAFIRLHLDQTEGQATEGCSLWFVRLKVIISHNFLVHGCTTNLDLCCLFCFFIITCRHHAIARLFEVLVSLLNRHFLFHRKRFLTFTKLGGCFFMFDHLSVCIGLDYLLKLILRCFVRKKNKDNKMCLFPMTGAVLIFDRVFFFFSYNYTEHKILLHFIYCKAGT